MWETIRNGNVDITAYLAKPSGKGTFPAVVVLQEIFGLNAHIRDTADRLAAAGFVALAPALFQRTAPGLDIGYSPEDIKLGRSHKDQTTAPQLLSDLDASIAFLEERPDVHPGKVGCIGFCFGGHVAFLAATLPKVAATASFYGTNIPVNTPGGGSPTITRAKDIKGEIELFFGTKDASIPAEHVSQIEDALKDAGVPHAIHRYPAGHGFFCNYRSDYDKPSAEDAWEKVVRLFKRTLD